MEARMQTQLSILKAGLLALSAVVVIQTGFSLVPGEAGAQSPRKAAFEELSVERINIVDDKGGNRLVISNQQKFPNPIVDGKEYPRSIKPAGIVFYNADGNEVGGVAIAETPDVKASILAFDYSNSEAIGFSKYEDGKGGYQSAFVILDRQPLDANISKVGSVGKNRITLSNKDQNAEIVLSDAEGKTRIKLIVDARGSAKFQILDKAGKVISQMP
ncbi:MAG: hypothetical protein WAU45_10440 [Blastocatellia bacterium]